MNINNAKKNALFFLYILFNALLISILFVVPKGYLVVSFFVFGGHVRDVVAILVHLVHSTYTKCVKACRNRYSVHPTTSVGNRNFIYSLVPVYNEDLDMVTQNLDSLVAQKLPDGTVNKVVLIFDGLNDKKYWAIQFYK